jgi:hypothetical protein
MSNEPHDWRTVPQTSPMPWDDDPTTSTFAEGELDEIDPDITAEGSPSGLGPQAMGPGVPGGQGFWRSEPEPFAGPKDGWPTVCCTVGPCKHATRIWQEQDVIHGVAHWKIYRYCELLEEDGGTMMVSNQLNRLCDRHAPPWWSIRGWMQKVRTAQAACEDQEKNAGGAHPGWKALAAIAKLAGIAKKPGTILPEAGNDKEGSA